MAAPSLSPSPSPSPSPMPMPMPMPMPTPTPTHIAARFMLGRSVEEKRARGRKDRPCAIRRRPCSMMRSLREPRHSAHCASRARCARVAVVSPQLGTIGCERLTRRRSGNCAHCAERRLDRLVDRPADLEGTRALARGAAICISVTFEVLRYRSPRERTRAARAIGRRERERRFAAPVTVLSRFSR